MEKLAKYSAYFESMIDTLSEGVVFVEPNGTVTRMNSEALRLHGFSNLEEMTRNLADYPNTLRVESLDGKTLPLDQWPAARLLRGERFSDFEVKLNYTDGRRWIGSYRGTPVFDENNQLIFGVLTVRDISKYKLTEDRLRTSDAHQRFINEVLPIVIWEADAQGSITFTNTWWQTFSGQTLKDSLGSGWGDRIHPDHRERVLTEWLNSVRSGEKYEVDIPFQRADGQFRNHLVRGRALKDRHGRVIKWVGFALDNHDQITANEELERSESRLRTITEVLPHMIWTTDAEGHTEYFNSSWLNYTGMSVEDIRGSQWIQVLHPDDVERVKAEWKTSVQEGTPYDTEYRMRRASDGEYRWFVARALPIRDSEGRIMNWYGSNADIHDQKTAQLNYERSVDDSPAILWLTDAKGHCTYLSRQWYTSTGMTEADSLGFGWQNACHPDDKEHVARDFNEGNSLQRPFYTEYRLHMADGSYRWALDAGNPRFGSNGEYLGYAGTVFDIHDQKMADQRMNEAREKNREQLQRVFMQTPAAVVLVNGDDLRPEIANDRFLELVGTSEPIFGKPLRELLPSVEEPLFEMLSTVYKSGVPFSANEIGITFNLNQGLRYFDFSAEQVRDLDGRTNGLAIFAYEVTDQVKARYEIDFERRKVEESESQLRTLSNSIPQLVWMADHSGQVLWYNERWTGYTGLTAEQLGAEGWSQVLDPANKDSILSSWKHSLETGEPWEATFTLLGQNSARRWFLTRALPVRNQDGEIVRWFGSSTDIDEQRRSAKELEFLNRATESISSSLDPAQTLRNLTQVVIGEMGGWCQIHTLHDENRIVATEISHSDPKKEEISREFDRKFPVQYDVNEDVGRVFITGETLLRTSVADELLVEKAPNAEWLEILRQLNIRSAVLVPLRIRGEVKGVLSAISDTRTFDKRDQKTIEELARRASLALENAILYRDSQLAIKTRDEFLSIASHELKTPLTSLKLQAQLLKRSIARNDPKAYSKERIDLLSEQTDKQVTRLGRLIDDMLDVSRIRTGKLAIEKEEFDLAELVHDVVGRMQMQFEAATGTVPIVKTNGPARGQWDFMRIEQVINNLLTNAIRYGNKKPVRIDLDHCENGKVRFSVTDQGIGIAKENHSIIFDRFERAGVSASEVSGLGLGLFITKQIVVSHGGRIWVESELGHGSTFFVELPCQTLDQHISGDVHVL